MGSQERLRDPLARARWGRAARMPILIGDAFHGWRPCRDHSCFRDDLHVDDLESLGVRVQARGRTCPPAVPDHDTALADLEGQAFIAIGDHTGTFVFPYDDASAVWAERLDAGVIVEVP